MPISTISTNFQEQVLLAGSKATKSSNGSDVDYRALDLLLHHVINTELSDHHRSCQVDRNDAIPEIFLQCADRIWMINIVSENSLVQVYMTSAMPPTSSLS